MSKRAHAHITEINSGHLSLITHPGTVTGSSFRGRQRHRLSKPGAAGGRGDHLPPSPCTRPVQPGEHQSGNSPGAQREEHP